MYIIILILHLIISFTIAVTCITFITFMPYALLLYIGPTPVFTCTLLVSHLFLTRQIIIYSHPVFHLACWHSLSTFYFTSSHSRSFRFVVSRIVRYVILKNNSSVFVCRYSLCNSLSFVFESIHFITRYILRVIIEPNFLCTRYPSC